MRTIDRASAFKRDYKREAPDGQVKSPRPWPPQIPLAVKIGIDRVDLIPTGDPRRLGLAQVPLMP